MPRINYTCSTIVRQCEIYLKLTEMLFKLSGTIQNNFALPVWVGWHQAERVSCHEWTQICSYYSCESVKHLHDGAWAPSHQVQVSLAERFELSR
jgi:hypothetical protein